MRREREHVKVILEPEEEGATMLSVILFGAQYKVKN